VTAHDQTGERADHDASDQIDDRRRDANGFGQPPRDEHVHRVTRHRAERTAETDSQPEIHALGLYRDQRRDVRRRPHLECRDALLAAGPAA